MYSPPWQSSRRKQRTSLSRPDELAEDVRSHIEEAKNAGCSSLRQIAFYLNSNGLCTARGREWGASQVRRTMCRLNRIDHRSELGPAPLRPDQLGDHVRQAKLAGCYSLREIATYLNLNGVRTVRGGLWTAMQVSRILRRIEMVAAE
jgi:Recombinase